MQFGGVSIPESLFNAAYSGSLVVFAGAGVSMAKPVDLPSFDKLINHIKTYVDPGGFLRNRSCKKRSAGRFGHLYRNARAVP